MGQGGAGRGAGGRDLKLQLAQLTAGPLQEGPDRAMSSILLETSLKLAQPLLDTEEKKQRSITRTRQGIQYKGLPGLRLCPSLAKS